MNGTPETDAALASDDRGSGWYRAGKLANLCQKLERERDALLTLAFDSYEFLPDGSIKEDADRLLDPHESIEKYPT